MDSKRWEVFELELELSLCLWFCAAEIIVIEDYKTSSLILKGCTSSLIDDDDNGKSPGVVARLMGLDSFPTSNFSDTQSKSTRFFDTQSNREVEQKDYHQVEQKRNIIEKFQTESLQPKSARSVTIYSTQTGISNQELGIRVFKRSHAYNGSGVKNYGS
ncbi:hypothetical protein Hanom_Chr01g00092201 [Helianthus anomalus]